MSRKVLNGRLRRNLAIWPLVSELAFGEASDTVGPLTIAATNSPRGDFIFATLTVQGPLVCHASAVQIVDAIGVNAGLSDLLAVNGPVTLAGELRFGNVGSLFAGNRIVIIANDGGDSTSGTFAGLPEGAVIFHGNLPFTIGYAGGDGNDVELLVHTAPSLLTSLSIVTNGFRLLTGQGAKFQFYPIEVSTELVTWSSLGVSTADVGGANSFLDTNAPLFPRRCYRAISP